MLLLTLDTQSRTRHAATDGQDGTDENPHLDETRVESLSRDGIQILEPEGWNDASEKAGRGLPNCPKLFGYANKTEGRQSATESLDGLKTHRPGGRVRYVGRGMVLQAVMSNLQVVSQGSWPDQRWKRR